MSSKTHGPRSRITACLHILASLTLLSFVIPSAGCATIVSSSQQELELTSYPVRAAITIATTSGSPYWSGSAPAVISLPRENRYIVTATAPGYLPVEVRIDRELNGWFIGNLLCGGIIGGIIDYATGAMWKLDPGMMSIELIPSGEVEPSEERGREHLVLLFRAVDEHGEAREMALPLVPDSSAPLGGG